MTVASMCQTTVTIHRRSVPGGAVADDWGLTYETAGATATALAYVEQTEATEVVVGQTTFATSWLVVFPAGTAIDASDWVEVDGRHLEVRGVPNRPAPRGVEHHVECRCEEVSG